MRAIDVANTIRIAGLAATCLVMACSAEDDPGSPDPDEPAAPTPTEPDWAPDGFCADSGVAWGFCEDFDGQGEDGPAAYPAPGSKLVFRAQSHITIDHVTCETSGDCTPYTRNGAAFTNSEDSGFGMSVTRVSQPFDFEGREGHVRFETVLKGHPRMVTSLQLSPRPTNAMPDVRRPEEGAMDHAPALTVLFQGDGGQPLTALWWNDGAPVHRADAAGPLGIDLGGLHTFDVYVSRTTLRVLLDGQEQINETVDDLGFERAYVHLALTSYNPVKDGYAGADANTFQWDNVAFDGPAYGPNALTPVGSQDVVFRAYSSQACSVRGVAADGPMHMLWGTWHSWTVRLPDDGVPVTAADITCDPVPDSPHLEGSHVADITSIKP